MGNTRELTSWGRPILKDWTHLQIIHLTFPNNESVMRIFDESPVVILNRNLKNRWYAEFSMRHSIQEHLCRNTNPQVCEIWEQEMKRR